MNRKEKRCVGDFFLEWKFVFLQTKIESDADGKFAQSVSENQG